MMLWKHTCDVCHRSVCDDCAPRSTKSAGAKGEITNLRVCKTCGTTGHRLGKAVNDNSATDGTQGTGAARPDPNSETERELRVRLIEERNKAQQRRGCPQLARSASGSRATVAGEKPASPAPAPSSPAPALSRTSVSSPAALPSPLQNSENPEHPVSPALEAAMRRQLQQQQARGCAASSSLAAKMSPKKKRLLFEIETLLEKHREDPPFGLRASDETKLRGYLQFLKTKYHSN
ncbi:hypothetical protein LPMP_352500 [Leishmania panamensis]|uniref:Uncharacterized protein n=1 Tax=Leishmania panamensis TaxID=5679 RepID=A0A088SKP0_LEIPA|nr:hypothetical protein LPMP_352500 [Leishmania panamensis]AIO02387.1 hypothetical protein LPMP_352500 [Leishmania panamensis]